MKHTFRTDDKEVGSPAHHNSFSATEFAVPPPGNGRPFQNCPSPIEMNRLATQFMDMMRQQPTAEDRPVAHLAWMAFLVAQSARTEYGRLCSLRELATAASLIKSVDLRECLQDIQCAELTEDRRHEYESIVLPSPSSESLLAVPRPGVTNNQTQVRQEVVDSGSRDRGSRHVRSNAPYRVAAMVAAAAIVIGLGSLQLRQTGKSGPSINDHAISKAHDAPSAKPTDVDPTTRHEENYKPIEESRLHLTTVVDLDAPDKREAVTQFISNQRPLPDPPLPVPSPDVEFTWFNQDDLPRRQERDDNGEFRVISISNGTVEPARQPDRNDEVNARVRLREAEASFGPDSAEAAQCVADLAGIHFESRAYAKAAPLYRRYLDILQKEPSLASVEIMRCTGNLAQSYLGMDRFAEAISLFEPLLVKYEGQLGANDPLTVACVNHLAKAFLENGDYAKAVPLFQRLLQRVESTSGSRSFDFASHCDNLAIAKLGLKEHQAAKELFERAAAIRQDACEPDDPALAISANYAGILSAAGHNYQDARLHFDRGREIVEKHLGTKHLVTAVIYDNLAKMNLQLGDADQALAFWSKSYSIRRDLCGPMHPDTLAIARSLCELKTTARKQDAARRDADKTTQN